MKSIRKQPRDCSCGILAKSVAAFYSCPENLREAKLKSSGLVDLAEEVLRQPSLD